MPVLSSYSRRWRALRVLQVGCGPGQRGRLSVALGSHTARTPTAVCALFSLMALHGRVFVRCYCMDVCSYGVARVSFSLVALNGMCCGTQLWSFPLTRCSLMCGHCSLIWQVGCSLRSLPSRSSTARSSTSSVRRTTSPTGRIHVVVPTPGPAQSLHPWGQRRDGDRVVR
jgi:hypothetical protein